VLVFENIVFPPLLVVMEALPAVLVLKNSMTPPLLKKVGLFEELLTMPVPVTSNSLPERLKE